MPNLPSPQPNSTIVLENSDSALRSQPTHGVEVVLPGMNPSSPTRGVLLSIVPFSLGLLKHGRFGPTSRQPCIVRLLTFNVLAEGISPVMKKKEQLILFPPTVSRGGLL